MLINRNIYFVHIPRTGGRFIRDIMALNFNCEHNDIDHYRGKEVHHLTYPEHEQFLNYTLVKKFSVIRDPIDRFINSILNYNKINNEKFQKMMKSQETFDEMVNNIILNDRSNWFVPQTNFIDYKTLLWRFENKFNNHFVKWFLDNFKLEITKLKEKNDMHTITSDIKIDLNEKQKQFIKNYYYKDYKLLDY